MFVSVLIFLMPQNPSKIGNTRFINTLKRKKNSGTQYRETTNRNDNERLYKLLGK